MAWVLVAGLVALAVLAAAFWLLVLEPANFGTLFRAQGVKVVPLLRLPLLDLFRYSKQVRTPRRAAPRRASLSPLRPVRARARAHRAGDARRTA
jgi:hypothetical protein